MPIKFSIKESGRGEILQQYLKDLSYRAFDLGPIAERCRVIVDRQNEEGALMGIDQHGNTYDALAKSTWKTRSGSGPPLAPRGSSSPIVAAFRTVVEDAGHDAKVVRGSWPGIPWIGYHRTGTHNMPERDPVGIRPHAWQQIGVEFHNWARAVLEGKSDFGPSPGGPEGPSGGGVPSGGTGGGPHPMAANGPAVERQDDMEGRRAGAMQEMAARSRRGAMSAAAERIRRERDAPHPMAANGPAVYADDDDDFMIDVGPSRPAESSHPMAVNGPMAEGPGDAYEPPSVEVVRADSMINMVGRSRQAAKRAAAERAAIRRGPILQEDDPGLYPSARVSYGTPSYSRREGETREVDEAIRAVFGRDMTHREVARLVGAPADTTHIFINRGFTARPSIDVEIQAPGVTTMRRAFYTRVGGAGENLPATSIHNDEIGIAKSLQGQGMGTKIFAGQVEEAAKAGFKYIAAFAAKEKGVYNGYSTWPKLGYDGAIPASVVKKLPKEFEGATNVSELMATPEGQKWWDKNGVELDLTFDLTPGSYSRRALDAYMKRKGYK